MWNSGNMKAAINWPLPPLIMFFSLFYATRAPLGLCATPMHLPIWGVCWSVGLSIMSSQISMITPCHASPMRRRIPDALEILRSVAKTLGVTLTPADVNVIGKST